ncbi:MAG: hypothetical protein IIU86_00995 [Oscillospiraceae bacterium]|nr:hypothetical protein [Oscillospiraceae bacterium]
MSIGVSELSAADVAAVVGNNRNDGYNNGGMFGNDWAWIVILLLFGWGGRGFGGFGGGFGGGYGAGCGAPCATQADVRAAVDQQTLISKIDQQTYGLADSFTALNNTLNSNFRGIDNAICTLGYQNQAGVNALSAQLAQCCCDTRYAIGEVNTGIERTGWNISKQISDCCCDVEKMNLQSRFDAQAYNCNTLHAIDKLGDRIIDYMSNEKVQALRDENQALRLAASQAKQNEYLISRLGDKCPEPAYIVQPPQQVTFPANCCGTVNYAAGGCGGCGSF